MTREEQSAPSLSSVKAGDKVIIDSPVSFSHPQRIQSRVAVVTHVNPKGRIYIASRKLWGDWRYGFDPATGRAKQYGWDVMRCDPDKVAELETAEAKHRAETAERERRQKEQVDFERRAIQSYEADQALIKQLVKALEAAALAEDSYVNGSPLLKAHRGWASDKRKAALAAAKERQ